MDKYDLELLEQTLLSAKKVVAMEDIYDGETDPDVIGLRHDVDHDLTTAVEIAQWEAERGFRSTYYMLHTAPEYWFNKGFLIASMHEIAELGHEIGIHNNAIAESLMSPAIAEPADFLEMAIEELRGYGYKIRGTVAHGDPLCRDSLGQVRFVNDQLFTECKREFPVKWNQYPLSHFGLEYDANWLPRGNYISDSGGQWAGDNSAEGQLHILWHPCWWKEVFNS